MLKLLLLFTKFLILPSEIHQGDLIFIASRDSFEVLTKDFNFSSPFRYKGVWLSIGRVDMFAETCKVNIKLRIKGKIYSKSISIKPLRVREVKLKLRYKFPKRIRKRIRKENLLCIRKMKEYTAKVYFKSGFIKPLHGKITSYFGERRRIGSKISIHKGIDIAGRYGEPVFASNSGLTVLTGDFYLMGKTVIISHGMGLYTFYCHLDRIFVIEGQIVRRGQIIGLVGAAGRATAPHLHFGVYYLGKPVNPLSLFVIK